MKKAILLLFVVTICLAQTAPTIEWARCYGGSDREDATSIIQTADGGFIVAGTSESNDGDVSGNHGRADYWVVKLNSSGVLQWQKCLGGSDWDEASSIAQTTDGGYIVAGYSSSNDGDVSGNHGTADYWVVKLNSSGDIEWQKCLGGSGGDGANSIAQTADGGFIVAGTSQSNDGVVSGNHGGNDSWVVKLNSSGDIEWQKCLGGSSSDFAYSIAQTADGGYIVAGYSLSNDGDVSGNHGSADYWVVKLNSSGDILWQKCLGGSDWDVANSIAQTSDGGFIVAGYSYSYDGDVSGHHGDGDYWVVKLSPDPIGIAENPLPEHFSMSIAPNPFNSAVSITAPMGAEVEIYDVNGRMVDNISVGDGSPVPSASGRDDLAPTKSIWQPDASIGSGVYLVRAKIGGSEITKRVVYLK